MKDQEPVTKNENIVPVIFAWKDVEYTITIPKTKEKPAETRKILKGITGSIAPGDFCAIMGPSGAGKTSMISLLAGRIRGDGEKHNTSITSNGYALNARQWNQISGYVTQDDLFSPFLTVLETLTFSAKLKLANWTTEERKERVDEVIKALKLTKIRDSRVGSMGGGGISGGERRRLAIANEMINPSISVLLLDEPTSGLDASAALTVCQVLRDLADSGMSIVCSIHQPRPTILRCFDKLLLLADGQIAYFGPSATIQEYFEANLNMKPPPQENVMDWIIDMVAGDLEDSPSIPQLSDAYRNSDLYTKAAEDAMFAPEEYRTRLVESVNKGMQSRGFFMQIWILLMRTWLIQGRNPLVGLTQILTCICVGLIMGACYVDTYKKESQNVALQDSSRAVMMIILIFAFVPFDVLLTFPTERPLMLRERSAGLYSSISFFIARILADIPLHLIDTLIMGLTTYFLVGFNMSFGVLIAALFIVIQLGVSILQACGALAKNFEQANLVAMFFLMFFMIANGAFVRQLPVFLAWVKDISFLAFGNNIAWYFEFRNYTYPCSESKISVCDGPSALDFIGATVRDSTQLTHELLKCLAFWVIWRIIAFIGIRFFHTGNPVAVEFGCTTRVDKNNGEPIPSSTSASKKVKQSPEHV